MHSWPACPVPTLPGRGQQPRLVDTSTGRLEPVGPALPGEAGAGAEAPAVTMYVCGITPYDATHLGHAFTYLTYDLVNRVLRDAGYQVRYVQNVTDVDDPLLERAARDGVDWVDVARRETDLFRADMTALRILPPRHYIGVVEAVPLIVDMVAELTAAGATYSLDGDVYFSVAAAPRFGYVSGLDAVAMRALSAERGGDPDRRGKKDPLDPLLWRAERPGEPSWPSPFGPGRPGWHIECSAIARHYLGDVIDLQGGGADLVFPHHECSSAHAEVATGRNPFAQRYVHSGMVCLDGHKMSKSRGNLEFVSRLRGRGVDPAAIRLALLAHSHREDWEWTPAELAAAEARLARWRAAAALPAVPGATALLAEVRGALGTDLDTPAALAAVDGWTDRALAGHASPGGDDTDTPALTRMLVDALLGVDLDVVQT
ncbi:cysteine--1-D-myo-inosityl 2-amino-2-deoxy-alpha-D-glucopyranoside ligase [Pseudofrankia sp. BMG5.37]|uniref:cysteine--1-D-myo-inosityl 2-amino-2-deoxy-alpha-D-glucopyranoside ligase n=1 Tax=Pseudofrankia sp. BMG5.37 TaxID=3050035 RepID=UPI002893891B|nr:cysteine--1-D-myo-inosityl 2-amino-2-deoxy-alpha-D-glucopyranoside ligase [Pseudofrankia sp. BMG5.37]MDT3444720.1 cysteine--1-D-myo-inosityl 2-amino-2-deoxy-alpha-D-glucopyranoside ligase [Pseudofrankia sp. BMG5.37]